MPRPDLTVCLVAYNCREDLIRCARSIYDALKEISVEVVLADNASSDGVLEAFRREFPQVRLVEMGKNAGFAKANNADIEVSSGRHVLLLNPDTEVHAGALDEMVAFADAHPHAGVVAPRLLNPDLTDQGTARAFPTAAAALFGRRSPLTRMFPGNRWSRRFLIGLEADGEAPFEVDWVSGACLMVPREVVSEVGPLDEDFFMHWEDAEWCHRIKSTGRGVWVVPGAQVVHHEGGSRKGWPPAQVWHFHHGAYLYWKKTQAPNPLNPLRWLAGAALMARAALIIVRDSLLRRVRRPAPEPVPSTIASR